MLGQWWCSLVKQQLRRSSVKRGRGPRLEQLEDRTLMNAGFLDTTFGSGGIAQPGGFTYRASDINSTGLHSVAVQVDGKIVVAGTGFGPSGGFFQVSRFNTDGSQDTTFDSNVVSQTTKFSAGSTDQADTVAIQADGKIVVAGTTQAAGGTIDHAAVTRYNANGTLDTSFGANGHVIVVCATDQGAIPTTVS